MSEVRLGMSGGVAVLTLDSARARNGLTPEMADAITAHCVTVEAAEDIGVLVVTGANDTFCSGADTRRWNVQGDPASAEAFDNSSRVYGAIEALATVGVPTIAAGEGAAVGAGFNLLLAADLRVVSRTMRLIGGFGQAGLHPGGGFLSLLARRLGPEGTAAIALLGQEIDGERAAAAGLAWEAVPAGAALARALELAQAPAHDPELSRWTVRTLRTELGTPSLSLRAAIELERGVQMRSFQRRHDRTAR